MVVAYCVLWVDVVIITQQSFGEWIREALISMELDNVWTTFTVQAAATATASLAVQRNLVIVAE